MNVHISPFKSARRKNYNMQHVLFRILEKWREHLDKNTPFRGILMDLFKAFDCVTYYLLLAKLVAYGTDDNLLHHIHSYFFNRKQSVGINDMLVLHGSIHTQIHTFIDR